MIFYEIPWVDFEDDFEELIKFQPIEINNTSAEKIENLSNLSVRAKILLSAVAGAALQYLLDNDVPFTGDWMIKVEKEVRYHE